MSPDSKKPDSKKSDSKKKPDSMSHASMPPMGEAKPTVLIVDDTAQSVHFLDELLCEKYRVLAATNGTDAIELAMRKRPDLILLDVLMPDMDGYEVCRRLKAEPQLQEIPVIFVTVKAESKAQAVGLEVGAVDYITKPFDATIVRLRVSIHLEMKRRRDAIKQAQQALRTSEEKIRALFESSPDIILTLNQEADVLFQNRPLPEPLANMFPERQWRLLQQSLKELCTRQGKSRTLRLAGRHETWWEGRLIPLKEQDGDVLSMVVLTDITEKQILQAQAVRNTRLASLGVLSAGVAHEINNPNNAIHFNVSLLTDACQEIMPILQEKQAAAGEIMIGGMSITDALQALPASLAGIDASSQRITRIVENLKHMAREDSGDFEQEVRVVDVIESALSILQNRVRKCTNHLETIMPEGLPLVRGNAQQLEQVFINLILNGLQALPDRNHSIRIQAVLEQDGQHVLVTVTDEGCGIPKEHIKQVTQPFFSTKTAEGGTGLGLSISLTIIKSHSGELLLESQTDQGTVAKVRLPCLSSTSITEGGGDECD